MEERMSETEITPETAPVEGQGEGSQEAAPVEDQGQESTPPAPEPEAEPSLATPRRSAP